MSVACKQLSLAKNLTLKDCLRMEFRICQAMMAKHDFYEGVRANLVDKDRKPKWNPKNVYEFREQFDHYLLKVFNEQTHDDICGVKSQ